MWSVSDRDVGGWNTLRLGECSEGLPEILGRLLAGQREVGEGEWGRPKAFIYDVSSPSVRPVGAEGMGWEVGLSGQLRFDARYCARLGDSPSGETDDTVLLPVQCLVGVQVGHISNFLIWIEFWS